jgi:outer membrane protein assembly factor BamB
MLNDPNGDTPLPGGGVLITEIGGWVDRVNRQGQLTWSLTTPTNYPSDAQLMPDGNVLVASYTSPGRVDIITPRGHIVWTYEATGGAQELNHPSLAVPLPNGMIALNDDFNQRVVVIDRRTKRIVWQYGHDGVVGSGPGYLSNPDGIELLP